MLHSPPQQPPSPTACIPLLRLPKLLALQCNKQRACCILLAGYPPQQPMGYAPPPQQQQQAAPAPQQRSGALGAGLLGAGAGLAGGMVLGDLMSRPSEGAFATFSLLSLKKACSWTQRSFLQHYYWCVQQRCMARKDGGLQVIR